MIDEGTKESKSNVNFISNVKRLDTRKESQKEDDTKVQTTGNGKKTNGNASYSEELNEDIQQLESSLNEHVIENYRKKRKASPIPSNKINHRIKEDIRKETKKCIKFADLIGIIAEPSFHLKRQKYEKYLSKDPGPFTFSMNQEDIFTKESYLECQNRKNHSYSLNLEYFEDSKINSLKSASYIQNRAENDKESKEVEHPEIKESNFFPLSLSSWEDHIIWNENGKEPLVPKIRPYEPSRIINEELEKGQWASLVIWDEENQDLIKKTLKAFKRPYLSEMDSVLILEKVKPVDSNIGKSRVKTKLSEVEPNESIVKEYDSPFLQPLNDRFNVSCDKYYEIKDPKLIPIGESQGRVELQHSIPASKLVASYYKPALTKQDLRAFHRPLFKFLLQRLIYIEPPLVTKETTPNHKKEAQHSIPRKLKDLTLTDYSQYVLFEYSEENPPLIMKQGMATLIHHYYRKKGLKDKYVPKADHGIVIILEYSDPSPFLGFGDVRPGQTVAAIYNNLFRGPLFSQPVESTDFLLIRSSHKGDQKYMIRELGPGYVVGQILPLMDVYGPQSRKANQYCKRRLEVATYRLYNKKENKAKKINIAKVSALFPQFPEMNVRRWLKETSDYVKVSRDTGWWILKKNAPNFSEEELRALMTPEMVCRYESMLAGKQRLLDAGYWNELDETFGEEDEAIDTSHLDEEVKLAPWHVSRNFLLATQGKTLVELVGPGDPTGRGEGFSFLRVAITARLHENWITKNLKSNKPSGKITIAQQQQAYKETILKIWDAQLNALSSTEDLSQTELQTLQNEEGLRDDISNPDDEEIVSIASLTSKSSKTGQKSFSNAPLPSTGRYLVITRHVRDPRGQIVVETETITDQRVITAYMAQTKLIATKIKKKSIHEKKRPGKRVTGTEPGLSDFSSPLTEAAGSTLSKKLKCGACGHPGHMKTNKSCPMFGKADTIPTAEFANLEKEHAQEPIKISITKSTFKEVSIKLKQKAEEEMTQREKKIARDASLTQLSKELHKIWIELTKTPNSWPFHMPVSEKEAPNYLSIITKPMDLSTIRKKITTKAYFHSNQFFDDVKQMIANCIFYNGQDHPFTDIANNILTTTESLLQENSTAFGELNSLLVEESNK